MCLVTMQSRGVMVAQVILVHLVEVRILAGLPFFLPEWAKKTKYVENMLHFTQHSHTSLFTLPQAKLHNFIRYEK